MKYLHRLKIFFIKKLKSGIDSIAVVLYNRSTTDILNSGEYFLLYFLLFSVIFLHSICVQLSGCSSILDEASPVGEAVNGKKALTEENNFNNLQILVWQVH